MGGRRPDTRICRIPPYPCPEQTAGDRDWLGRYYYVQYYALITQASP